jgi:hypothetical protein
MGKSTTGNSSESDRVLDGGASLDKVGATDQGQFGNPAFPEPKAEDTVEARKEGVLDAIKSSTEEAYKRGANEGYGDAPGPEGAPRRIEVDHNVFNLAPILDGSPEDVKKRLDPQAENSLSEGQVAGLLETERSGRNRTDHVKVLVERLGVKSAYEVTDAGPPYTNDTSSTTVA